MLNEATLSQLDQLVSTGKGIRRIAILLGISRNTVRRYVRPTDRQRVNRSRAKPAWHARALELQAICSNAAVITSALHCEGVVVSTRSVQRVIKQNANARGETPRAPSMIPTAEAA